MRAIITGTVQKVRTWENDKGGGWAATIKESGDYGKKVEVTGFGSGPSEGQEVTVTGDANVRFELWKAKVSGDGNMADEEIPF